MMNLINQAMAAEFKEFKLLGQTLKCPTTGCGWEQLVGREGLINNVIVFLLYIAVPLATIMLIYGGVLLLTSGGSEDRISKGKSAIYTAVAGLAIVFGSYIIYNLVIRAIFGIQD